MISSLLCYLPSIHLFFLVIHQSNYDIEVDSGQVFGSIMTQRLGAQRTFFAFNHFPGLTKKHFLCNLVYSYLNVYGSTWMEHKKYLITLITNHKIISLVINKIKIIPISYLYLYLTTQKYLFLVLLVIFYTVFVPFNLSFLMRHHTKQKRRMILEGEGI